MRDEQHNLSSMLCEALLEQNPNIEVEAFELFEKVFMTARAARDPTDQYETWIQKSKKWKQSIDILQRCLFTS